MPGQCPPPHTARGTPRERNQVSSAHALAASVVVVGATYLNIGLHDLALAWRVAKVPTAGHNDAPPPNPAADSTTPLCERARHRDGGGAALPRADEHHQQASVAGASERVLDALNHAWQHGASGPRGVRS